MDSSNFLVDSFRLLPQRIFHLYAFIQKNFNKAFVFFVYLLVLLQVNYVACYSPCLAETRSRAQRFSREADFVTVFPIVFLTSVFSANHSSLEITTILKSMCTLHGYTTSPYHRFAFV